MRNGETVPLHQAVGRTVKTSLFSPASTPTCDTSAMDGFAVCSTLTASASPQTPLLLRIVGSIVAGDEASTPFDTDVVDGVVPCVEIMTGAPFPLTRSEHCQYDACVPREHTRKSLHDEGLIQIEQPVEWNQHRRVAGGDYSIGDPIAEEGAVLDPRHIMAAASVGVDSFHCFRRVRIGVLSTGAELLQGCDSRRPHDRSRIPDANAPYLLAAMRELGAESHFLGTAPDGLIETSEHIRSAMTTAPFDIIVSSGAVSAGKMDHIPAALKTLQAAIHFHHVAMRPGHPALLATVPLPNQVDEKVTYFGLPGNPIAAAACFRFLFMPYYHGLLGNSQVPCTTATLRRSPQEPDARMRGLVFSNRKQIDHFRHGRAEMVEGELVAQFSAQQSPAKISPFAAANCWIHVPQATGEVLAGDRLHVYFLHDSSVPVLG